MTSLTPLRPHLTRPFRKADLGLRGTDAEPDDLASTFGRDRHGDYRSDRDDAAAVVHFEVSGVEPKIRPFALDRSGQERY
jgi:hypothetical protein